MTRTAKLYQRLLAGRSLSFTEFERLLRAFDFEYDHATGSHRIYRHRDSGRRLSLQPRGKDAKPYQIRQFLDIVEELGLSLDEGA